MGSSIEGQRYKLEVVRSVLMFQKYFSYLLW